MKRPTPAPMDAPLRHTSEVDAHRDLDCPHYGDCLDAAQGWQGFSCRGCPLGRLAHLQPPEPPEVVPPAVKPERGTDAMVRVINERPNRGWTADEVAKAAGVARQAAVDTLPKLARAGRIRRIGMGLYEAVTP